MDWDRVRVFDREIAQMFLNMTKLEKEAQVFFLCPHLSHLFFCEMQMLLGQMHGYSHIHS